MLKKKIKFLVFLVFLGLSNPSLFAENEEETFDSLNKSREDLTELEPLEKESRQKAKDRKPVMEDGKKELTEIENTGKIDEPDVVTKMDANKHKDDLNESESAEIKSSKKSDEFNSKSDQGESDKLGKTEYIKKPAEQENVEIKKIGEKGAQKSPAKNFDKKVVGEVVQANVKKSVGQEAEGSVEEKGKPTQKRDIESKISKVDNSKILTKENNSSQAEQENVEIKKIGEKGAQKSPAKNFDKKVVGEVVQANVKKSVGQEAEGSVEEKGKPTQKRDIESKVSKVDNSKILTKENNSFPAEQKNVEIKKNDEKGAQKSPAKNFDKKVVGEVVQANVKKSVGQEAEGSVEEKGNPTQESSIESKVSKVDNGKILTKENNSFPAEQKNVILLKETDNNTDKDVADDFDNALSQGKKLSKNVNDIVEKLRIVRNKLHEKYYDKVNKVLDKFLQDIGLKVGEAKDKDRFKFLNKSVKKEFQNEWKMVKEKITGIDVLENKLLKKLKELDDKYEKAVEASIEVRKVSLDILNVSNKEKIANFLSSLKDKKDKISNINKEITQTFKRSIENLINNITEKFKIVKSEFNNLKEKGLDLDKYEQTLEDAKNRKKFPKWRKLIEKIVDTSLDYISAITGKAKTIWRDWASRIQRTYSVFIGDVKNKAKELKNNKNETKTKDLKNKNLEKNTENTIENIKNSKDAGNSKK